MNGPQPAGDDNREPSEVSIRSTASEGETTFIGQQQQDENKIEGEDDSNNNSNKESELEKPADNGSYYWDYSTMAPLNTVSAVSKYLKPILLILHIFLYIHL